MGVRRVRIDEKARDPPACRFGQSPTRWSYEALPAAYTTPLLGLIAPTIPLLRDSTQGYR
jgi:hypothetical protein